MKPLFILLFILLYSCSDSKSTNTPNTTKDCLGIENMPAGFKDIYMRIIAVLPNPTGNDDYNEKFELKFFKDSTVDWNSFYIKDDEGTRWNLSDLEPQIVQNGEAENCKSRIYTSNKVAQLLNSGDKVYLFDFNNILIQTVIFGQTKDGEWVYPT